MKQNPLIGIVAAAMVIASLAHIVLDKEARTAARSAPTHEWQVSEVIEAADANGHVLTRARIDDTRHAGQAGGFLHADESGGPFDSFWNLRLVEAGGTVMLTQHITYQAPDGETVVRGQATAGIRSDVGPQTIDIPSFVVGSSGRTTDKAAAVHLRAIIAISPANQPSAAR